MLTAEQSVTGENDPEGVAAKLTVPVTLEIPPEGVIVAVAVSVAPVVGFGLRAIARAWSPRAR